MTQATLVMESRGLIPGARSFTVSDSWTRLYRTDLFFLDMSFEAQENSTCLLGQLLESSGAEVCSGGSVVLYDVHRSEIARAEIGATGEFKLVLTSEQRGTLSLELGQHSFNVPDFDLT